MASPPIKRLKLQSQSDEGSENEASENESVDSQTSEPKRKSKKASILSLNDDCLYEVIKKLPLNDLCAMGETCERIHALCADYFPRGFKEKVLIIDSVREDGGFVKRPSAEKYIDIFETSIRNVVLGKDCASKKALQRLNSVYKRHQTIEGEGDQEVIQNIAVIKELRLESWSNGLRKSHGPSFADAVKEVESLTLANTTVIGDLNQCLLKFMPNLKELRIWEDFNEPSETDWMTKSYPKLERFIWHSNEELPIDKFKQFLSNNPNISYFSLLAKSQNTVQKLIKDRIRVNELFFDLPSFFFYDTNDMNTRTLLNDLLVLCKQQSCRLHLNWVNRESEIPSLVDKLWSLAPYIEGLYFGNGALDKRFVQSLVTFEHLKVLQLDIGEHSDPFAAIPNVEEIYVYWAVTQSNRKRYQRALLNYVEQSKPLKKIFLRCKSQQYKEKVYQEFDAARSRLADAKILKMYFRTENGLDTIKCNYDNIELVRVETEAVKNPFINEYLTTKKFSSGKGYGRYRRWY